MRKFLSLLLLIAVACASPHSGIRVESRKLAAINLAAVQTWQWGESGAHLVDTTGTWSGNSANLQNLVRESVERELREAGLRQVAAGAGLRVELSLTATRAQSDSAPGHEQDVSTHPITTEGALQVEIYQTSTNALVWRGTARSTAREVKTPEQAKARVEYALHELFENLDG